MAGFLALASCRPGAPHPVALAADEALKAPPNVVYDAALATFTEFALALKSNDPERGVLESEYFDVTTVRPEARDYPDAERFIRIRVLVGPDTLHASGSRLGVQAIYSPFGDPTAGTTRRSERAIPKSHPGMEVVKALVESVKQKTRSYEH
ncbi:MAG TPA: hypothetical protein VGI83_08110 [Gemmatimonadales bacterium]